MNCFLKMISITYCSCIIMLLFISCECYNLNTADPVVISKPLRENINSYFGYSVQLLEHHHKWSLIVGAPRANNTEWNHASITESGVLYACKESSSSCRQIVVDNTGNVPSPDHTWKDRKNYEWLGVTIDATTGPDPIIVTCGHRWCNDQYLSAGARYMNGVCYWGNLTLLDSTDFNYNDWIKVLPLVEQQKQTVYNPTTGFYEYLYYVGQVGISSHIMKDQSILLGAPGTLMWSGTVVNIITSASVQSSLRKPKHTESRRRRSTFMDIEVPDPSSVSNTYDYLGYSVSSGKFWSGTEYTLVGSPRAGNSGKVFIMTSNMLDKETIYGTSQLEAVWWASGFQAWSYFGASITATDLNGDGIDEVIVGAPYFTIRKTVHTEDGCVWVYKVLDVAGHVLEVTKMIAPTNYDGRFGSALNAIGDIDQDGYKDLAVGAPQENEGRGAVYIYRGGKLGIRTPYSQRIQASEVRSSLRGFGSVISRPADTDGDQYLDIAVGSPYSGDVVILKGRSVVRLHTSFISDVTAISLTDSCFTLDLCLTYSGVSVRQKIDVTATVTLDAHSDHLLARADFETGTSPTVVLDLRHGADPVCRKFNACLKNINNNFKPLVCTATLSSNKWTEDASDCPSCDMIDPFFNKVLQTSLIVTQGCGQDKVCNPQISVTAQHDSNNNPYVIGSGTILHITLVVNVEHETAYGTWVSLTFPESVSINSIPLVCSDSQNDLGQKVYCSLESPLIPPAKVTLTYMVKIDGYVGEIDQLTANISYGGHGTEDKSQSLKIPVVDKYDLAVYGVFQPDVLTYDGNETDQMSSSLIQVQVDNLGTTPVRKIDLFVDLPHLILNAAGDWIPLFSNDFEVISTTYSDCVIDNDDFTITECKQPPDYKGDGHVTTCGSSKVKYMRLKCSLYHNQDHKQAVRMMANIKNLIDSLGHDKTVAMQVDVTLTSSPSLSLNGQNPNIGSDKQSVWLFVIPDGWSPPMVTKSVPWWVYLVSILGGLVILAVLVLVFYKCGFFTRRRVSENVTATSTDTPGSSENLLDDGSPENDDNVAEPLEEDST